MSDIETNYIERVRLANDPNVPISIIREHLIRYIFAMESITDKDVLDIAIGSGYGSYLMSHFAKSISGYDYSQEAIDEANLFPYKCDTFIEVRNLEEDKSLSNPKHETFDVVTFFETIEHLSNPEVLLKNIKTVMNPGGVIYISTPNDLNQDDHNKWHKTHFDFYSLHNLLSEKFDDSKITMHGADMFGISDDFTKMYIVAKIEV
jgi:2-polyprenyl-3-methyl-5-hydroxy-6-metoxy-1,4-benzoquinol methylase